MAQKNKNIENLLEDRHIVLKSVLKVGLILALIALFLGAVAFVSFDWAFSALVHSRKEVKVPDITKQSLSVALDSLEAGNLALRKAGEEFQPDLPAGSIIRQLPPAGTVVREGKVIRVWISQGTESINVPPVSGMTLRNAELIIRQNSLTVGTKDTAYSLTVEKGSVISQDPAANELATKGQTVNLVVSAGTPPSSMRLMPDFRQQKLSDVNLWASGGDIEVQIQEDKDSMFPNGTIVKQSPEPDSEVAPKSTIKITVSRRPAAEGEKMNRIHYELPQGKDANRVKIIVEDSMGEREVLNEMKQPGSKIDVTVPYGGSATFRIYVDGILVREKEMK